MARFRLSTGILSPLNSDISLNDISAFSFGSISSTPDKDCDGITNKCIEKDSESISFSKRTMKEGANVIQVIANDIKKQSDINAEREEEFKESYQMLKQSMDELFYNTASASILSPISKDVEIENFTHERKSNCNINADKTEKKSQNSKVYKKTLASASEAAPEIKKTERIKNDKSSSFVKKEQKNNHLKLPTNAKLSHGCKPKISTASSSTQTGKSLEIKQTTSKKPDIKREANERAVKDFQFKSQQKIAVSNHMPTIENKSLSIEKSIEVAVGLEMDKTRRLILDQNIIMLKELAKLQDTVQKQTEVTGYLFSVIDQLVEENKKLISKHK